MVFSIGNDNILGIHKRLLAVKKGVFLRSNISTQFISLAKNVRFKNLLLQGGAMSEKRMAKGGGRLI